MMSFVLEIQNFKTPQKWTLVQPRPFGNTIWFNTTTSREKSTIVISTDMATKSGVTVANSVTAIKHTGWKYIFMSKYCYYQTTYESHMYWIFFCIIEKNGALIHLNKKPCWKGRFWAFLRMQELKRKLSNHHTLKRSSVWQPWYSLKTL